MRVRVVFTAISLMVAAPVWAQSKPILSSRTTLARVDHACDAIAEDDYLEPYVELVLPASPLTLTLAAPDFSERVPILPGLEGRQIFGDGDTFSIARGTAHGVLVGACFSIYRDRKDGKPLVRIGEAMVTDPSMTSAKLLLMTTTDVVYLSDIAVLRR